MIHILFAENAQHPNVQEIRYYLSEMMQSVEQYCEDRELDVCDTEFIIHDIEKYAVRIEFNLMEMEAGV